MDEGCGRSLPKVLPVYLFLPTRYREIELLDLSPQNQFLDDEFIKY